MNDVERQVLAALRELDSLVQAMRTASPKQNLMPVFEKIDTLTRELGPAADHQLLHYLHKKSYEKALRHLEGREAQGASGASRT